MLTWYHKAERPGLRRRYELNEEFSQSTHLKSGFTPLACITRQKN